MEEGKDTDLTRALEDYIKVILELEMEEGSATVSEIAKRIGVKPPSVTFALQKLDKLGMVKYKRYQAVKLTTKGRQIAEELLMTHRALMEFFIMIGVDQHIASIDACEIEHVAHHETIEQLTRFMDSIREDI